jgi:thiol-disulfide isomerase/thioredoxin
MKSRTQHTPPVTESRTLLLSRRAFVRRAFAAAVVIPTLPAVLAACGDDDDAVGDLGPPEDFSFVPYQGVGDPENETEMLFSELFEEGRPVILNFWAGQCPPCRAEMPDFQRLADEYGDDILLLGIDVGVFTMLGTQDDARALLEELEITYPTGYAVDRDPLLDYEVTAMPTTIFFTPSGEMNDKRAGLILEDEMREKIESVLDAT